VDEAGGVEPCENPWVITQVPLSDYSRNNFVSQEFSQLTECRAESLAAEFPQCSFWLANFVLNNILRMQLPKEKAALAFAVIRRGAGALEEYEEARTLLGRFCTERQSISLYFQCLRRFESAIAMTWQALDFSRMGQDLFASPDGDLYRRINYIYNEGRHAKPKTLPAGHLHTVWLRNEGILTDGAHLTFDELRDLVRQVSRIAEKLSEGQTG
jgi:hypothetical protein